MDNKSGFSIAIIKRYPVVLLFLCYLLYESNQSNQSINQDDLRAELCCKIFSLLSISHSF
jgi:hypothetical protein